MWRRTIRRLRDEVPRRCALPAGPSAPADRASVWDATGDPGLQAIDHVYRMMRIDEEWSVREPRGFTWWGHGLAQRVWAEPPRASRGFEVSRVHAETDLLRDVPERENLTELLAVLNQFASLSAYVWDPATRRLTLRCGVYAHAENLPWLGNVLGAAVAIQAADAHIKVGLSKVLGGEPAVSAHPRSGPRTDPDDMLGVIEMFAAAGRGPSPFAAAEFAALAETLREHGTLSFGGDGGTPALTAEFPFYDHLPAIMTGRAGTALLNASAEERHPQLGSGLLVRLSLPDPPEAGPRELREAAEIAHALNRAEPLAWTASFFLGGWCASTLASVPTISFVTFLPAMLHAPGLLETFVLSAGLRARWAKAHLEGER